jgi:hypothetical protein
MVIPLVGAVYCSNKVVFLVLSHHEIRYQYGTYLHDTVSRSPYRRYTSCSAMRTLGKSIACSLKYSDWSGERETAAANQTQGVGDITQ